MAVQMELSRILIRELTDYQLIELKEVDGERGFPIVIGLPEAQAIERRLKGLRAPRPQTHELLATVIEELGGKLEAITITDLDDHTFIESGGKLTGHLVDATDHLGDRAGAEARIARILALRRIGDVEVLTENEA